MLTLPGVPTAVTADEAPRLAGQPGVTGGFTPGPGR